MLRSVFMKRVENLTTLNYSASRKEDAWLSEVTSLTRKLLMPFERRNGLASHRFVTLAALSRAEFGDKRSCSIL